jgi:hypothetical protein
MALEVLARKLPGDQSFLQEAIKPNLNSASSSMSVNISVPQSTTKLKDIGSKLKFSMKMM